MRITATLLTLALAFGASQVHANAGLDQLRQQVKNKLPKYGYRLSDAEIAQLSDRQIKDLDSTMSDRDLRQHEKAQRVRFVLSQ